MDIPSTMVFNEVFCYTISRRPSTVRFLIRPYGMNLAILELARGIVNLLLNDHVIPMEYLNDLSINFSD